MRIRIGDLDVRYEACGEGEPLLCLHGNGGSHRSFDPVLDAFAKEFRCYLPDARWQGGTARGKRPLTYPQLTEDALAFADAMGLETFSVVGYSDGGIVALDLARTGRVRRAVAIGANWKADASTPEFDAYLARGLQKNSRMAWLPWRKRRLELFRLMAEQARYPDPEGLRGIGCPVLLMAGDADLIPLAHTMWMQSEIPDARAVIVPECGHSVMRTQTQAFLDAALPFLKAAGN